MSNSQVVIDQKKHLESINLSKIKFKKRLQFFVFSLCLLILIYSIFSQKLTIDVIALAISGISGISAFSILLLNRIYKNVSNATLKGDALIINTIKNKNIVAPLESIRQIKSNRIGRTNITTVHYKLDGINGKTILLSNDSENNPKHIIRSAQNYYKKKRQIYKPDSVM